MEVHVPCLSHNPIKNSHGIKSGDLGGQEQNKSSASPLRLIQRFGFKMCEPPYPNGGGCSLLRKDIIGGISLAVALTIAEAYQGKHLV
ncbi:hypothetical protein TNCT_366341 [Trichonephila clavata]|uniref:Uncharacterized protein n=1 Tax=Trichonephila clavata TaxID=2740835 RepID=A0A8X6L685_TRICU|nr:hypothetical protein TNCT_366341 [Trichonephila clavata]